MSDVPTAENICLSLGTWTAVLPAEQSFPCANQYKRMKTVLALKSVVRFVKPNPWIRREVLFDSRGQSSTLSEEALFMKEEMAMN